MNDLTELDRAHERMQADETDTAARLGFYERVADTEFFLLLERKPEGDTLNPLIFPVENGKFALIFDAEERLSEFAEGIVPYVAMSGRAVANMLNGKNIGLGINLGVAPSSILLPGDAVGWLLEKISTGPEMSGDRPIDLKPPTDVPEVLLQALNTKLALAADMAKCAYLVKTRFLDGRPGLMLGFVNASPASEVALSQAVSEALIFSGIEKGTIDVAYFRQQDEICTVLERVGLRFDLPTTSKKVRSVSAPGMDPDRPPRLR